ncbi:hypothetical protein B0A52_02881 [Exophiala mesophila]|uniref:Uncharacterized protein n=1 Tax=Exophiala mesophila TaxID=212818 RepID=A0A438NE53_EXOME|nr:hypothetical protein B0A52_02881 [Exophiala mesophila]
MSSFFTVPASQRKRKRTEGGNGPVKARKRREAGRSEQRPETTEESSTRRKPTRPRDRDRDESISGSDSESQLELESGEESEATSEEGENAADRRIRLAQRYLDNIRQEVDEAGFDAEDLDKDIIATRLRQDVDEAKGRQFRLLANKLDFPGASHTAFRADTESTTGVAVSQPYLFTVSKDKTLIKWKLQSPIIPDGKTAPSRRKRPQQVAYVKGVKIRALAPQQHGHTGSILCVAASPDGKFVATGGADKKLIIWSAEDLRPLKTFTTHRDAVTALAFAPKSTTESGFGAQLFSASKDRSLKIYSLAGEDSLAYVETLFGHQDHILDVSAVSVDQCVSVGARDRRALWWKVVDESLTKFLGDSSKHDTYQTGSLDCVAALPPNHFVTGSDSGAISLWSVHKKKSLFTIQTAHGVDEPIPLEDVTAEIDPAALERLKRSDKRRPIPRAITALTALPGTDIILSGSWDGWIRIWKLSDDKRSLISLGVVGGSESHPTTQSDVVTGNVENETNGVANGDESSLERPAKAEARGPARGFVNSIAVFERRKEIVNEFGGTKEGECQGLCIVAGTGKDLRLGRFMKLPGSKNGAVVFEVQLSKQV